MENRESTTIRSAVINRAISYIFDHIEEDITVDDEALYQFMKRVRLERSAWRLKVEKEKSITEIGGEYGYSSSNFATAFKKHLESFHVIYERKKGNYHDLPKEWRTFIEKYQHLATKDTIYIECTIDDPSITDEDNCMYEPCQTISPEHPALKGHTDLKINVDNMLHTTYYIGKRSITW